VRPALLLLSLGPSIAAQEPPPLGVDGAQDVTNDGYAFVELETEREAYFVDEPIRLVLRFGFDADFLRTRMLQLFRTRLDVPAQLEASWLEDLPGALSLTPEDAPAPGDERRRFTFALGERVTEAVQVEDRSVADRRSTVLEIERVHQASAPGELTIEAPVLRFAFATRFEQHFVEGRVPADERIAFVVGRPLVLRIEPLPEEGRPPDFTGTVGHSFSVRAEAAPLSLAVGESFSLALVVEGEGNLESFPTPRLLLEGFHVYGTVDDGGRTRRRVTFDLAPLSADVREVPPIDFSVFDTEPPEGAPAGYRTLRTEPIAIEVRPAPAHGPEASTTSAAQPPAQGDGGRGSRILAGALASLALLALGLYLRRRGPRRVPGD